MKRRTLMAAAAAGLAAGQTQAGATEAAAGRPLVIGQSAPVTGALGGVVQAFNAGAQLAFTAANEQGGVRGRQLRYVTLDDQLDPRRTLANCEALLRDTGATVLFGGVGTANVEIVLPLLRDSGATLIGNYGLSDAARRKAAGLAFFVRAGYASEARQLLRHLATIGIGRVSVAHAAIPGGQEVLDALRAAASAVGVDVARSAAVKLDGSDADAAGQAVAESNAQAVVMFLSGAPAVSFIKAVLRQGARPMLCGLSVMAGEVVARGVGAALAGLTVTQVVPFPWAPVDHVAVTYRRLAERSALPIGYPGYEGYLNGLVMLEILKRTGEQPTRARLRSAASSLTARLAGLDLDFTRGDATGSRLVDLVHVNASGRFAR